MDKVIITTLGIQEYEKLLQECNNNKTDITVYTRNAIIKELYSDKGKCNPLLKHDKLMDTFN